MPPLLLLRHFSQQSDTNRLFALLLANLARVPFVARNFPEFGIQ